MYKNVFTKQNKALLYELVRTDFKLRYQGSVLGYTWSLLRPLLLFLILYIVFAKFLRFGGDVSNFPVYLLLGIVLWQFFADMTSQGLGAIVLRGELIRKIRIPRWIIILSASFLAVINLGLNLVVVALFALFSGVSLSWLSLLAPLILVEIYLLGFGLSLLLSAAFVKYRDMSYVWEVVLQAGFYITPVLYTLSVIPSTSYQKILLTNPMAQAIQDARYLLVTSDTLTTSTVYGSFWYRVAPVLLTLLIFVTGVFYFKRQSVSFAEDL